MPGTTAKGTPYAEPDDPLSEWPTTSASVAAKIDTKADLASPALTGTPTAPTPAAGDNDTSIATTAFVLREAVKKSGDTMTGPLKIKQGAIAGVALKASNDFGSAGPTLQVVNDAETTYANIAVAPTPLHAQHAASKGYVDGVVGVDGANVRIGMRAGTMLNSYVGAPWTAVSGLPGLWEIPPANNLFTIGTGLSVITTFGVSIDDAAYSIVGKAEGPNIIYRPFVWSAGQPGGGGMTVRWWAIGGL